MAGAPGGPVRSAAARGTNGLADGDEPEHLLLVEDDPGDALLIEEFLADTGLRIRLTWARTIARALELLADGERPACVLLDLHLPDSQGLDGLSTMLAAAPQAAVIVLTGLSEAQAGLAAVGVGAQDYLLKGQLEPEWLGRAIRYAVQRKQVELSAAALQAGRLRAEENARLERGLLPRPLVSGDRLDVVTRYRPSRMHALLGGDFFDVVETADGAVHAVIGDVAGHGAAEAAMGVCLRVAWRSFVLAGLSGPPLIEMLERLLLAERADNEAFVTLTSITLTPDRRAARVVRAGHPGLLLRDGAGEVTLVETAGGIALGMMPGLGEWPEERVAMPPGSGLLLFTDGLFEGLTGPEGQRLDLSGLLVLARRRAGLPAEEFVDALIAGAEAASAEHGGLADDVAVIHLGWRPS
ncbi:PP2C family protein-serine/threonine phosphatase [Actinomadura parmotrematis]|uniref:SpoIIE family protein phosphatase n=1 Tax=Actinomadura parmotrematis TaxID=2864039 RepID=A0ABS7G304_9ACTN|nr:SpoIIE family protein phosphatase [Actinomadura parmotrematis]MBW8487098.1 SpoIIE family protein phosphatase [Actinomadura parmotrematis]